MVKKISSKQLAEEYMRDQLQYHPKQSEGFQFGIKDFLAGWAARGKADVEVINTELGPNRIAHVHNVKKCIEALDETT